MEPSKKNEFMQAAIDGAKMGLAEGVIPIGAVLVIEGRIVGRGPQSPGAEGECSSPCRDGLPGECGPPEGTGLPPCGAVFHPLPV